MSLLDRRDVPVSTDNRDSLARYEAAADQFHSYFGNPLATIDEALQADPHFIMGHCLRAGMLLTAALAVVFWPFSEPGLGIVGAPGD